MDAIIRDSLKDRDLSFVFPSKTAADAWARRALGFAEARAVETDRFMAWDRFRDLVFGGDAGIRAADKRTRTLWAASALAENEANPFLVSLLRAEYRKSWGASVPFIASIPPDIGAFRRAVAARSGEKGTFADLDRLISRYSSFLARTGLYESAWSRDVRLPATGRWIVFRPELIEDFDDYRANLENQPRVRLIPAPGPGSKPPLPRLLEFPNLHEELRWVFSGMAVELDSGRRPEELAVTVVDLTALRPWIERAAADSGVPVSVKSGFTLACYPVGRFFKAVSACVESGFDFESVRALLLDGFPPWREPDRMRALVRYGTERHAYAPWTEGGRMVDAWEESFRVSGEPSGLSLRSLYGAVKRRVTAIVKARSFAAIRSELMIFRRDFLDEEGWDPDGERSLQRAMDELAALARAETGFGLVGAIGDPFPLFLSALSEAPYVPLREGSGVPVYPYRVSALVAPVRHFVLGCSQDGLRVRYDPASWLREDLRQALGRAGRDASADFAAAYAESGDSVTMSYAIQDLRGWTVPFSAFAAGPVGPPDDYRLARDADPLRLEAAFWSGETPLPCRLPAACLDAAGRSVPAPEPADTVAGPALDAVLEKVTRDGALELSQSAVKRFAECPFSWLLERGLGLREEDAGIGFFDAKLAGEAIHAAVRALNEMVKAMDPVPRPERAAEYRALVGRAIAEMVPVFERSRGPFLRPMLESYAPLLSDRLGRLLDSGFERFPGWAIGDTELDLEKPYPEFGCILVGRIDRLAFDGGVAAVIDYKKKNLPKASEVYAGDDGILPEPQTAAYVALAEAGGKRVTRVEYWSVEDARAFEVVSGDGGADGAPRTREAFGREVAAFEAGLGRVSGGIRSGAFAARTADRRTCTSCGMRAVCRTDYATE